MSIATLEDISDEFTRNYEVRTNDENGDYLGEVSKHGDSLWFAYYYADRSRLRTHRGPFKTRLEAVAYLVDRRAA